MIELDSKRPFHDSFRDAALAKFIFDPKNDGLKNTFEKAAGVKLKPYMDSILIFAEFASDIRHAKDGLTDLASELRTIPEDRFRSIAAKVDVRRHQG